MEKRQCTKCKCDFMLDANDFSFYEKMKVPAPTVCPDCRFKMRAVWRNEMSLYNRTCAKTGIPIISMYNPASPYIVVSHEYYESDAFNGGDYSREYDTSRSFFEQFDELLKSVPKAATFLSTGDGPTVNSNYSNYAGGLKNCYLVFNTGPAEESLYCRGMRKVKECCDSYFGFQNELLYECVNTQESSNVVYGNNVNAGLDCKFISNSSGCTHTLCSVNQRNASYTIFNQQVTKGEFEAKIKEIEGSYLRMEAIKKEFEVFEVTFPKRATHSIKSVDSTGDYLFGCKNVRDSFEVASGEDCRYIFSSKEIKDSYGTIGYGFRSERLLECTSTGYSTNCIGCAAATACQNVMYSHFMRTSQDCIGCDSMRKCKILHFEQGIF